MYAFRTTYEGRVYPSVSVSGIDLSGKTYAAAQTLLNQKASQIEATTASFSSGSMTWNPTYQQLGVTVDTASTLSEAYSVGRESDAKDRLTSAFGVAHGTHMFSLKINVDDATLNQWFDSVDKDINQNPHNASITVVGGKVQLDASSDGLVVDRDQARTLILNALRSTGSFQGTLPTVSVPAAIHTADLSAVQSQLETALATPVKLTFGKTKWTLTATELGQFVVQGTDNLGHPTVTLDQDSLSAWLSKKISGDVNSDPIDATVEWNDNLNNGAGGIEAKTASAKGVRLKAATLAQNVTASFLSDHSTISLPVTYSDPKVDSNNLAALGITTKVGVGNTNYAGSDDGRATNIQIGIGLLNGTLVAPGALFSFNHAIGEITADKGYVEAAVVDGQSIGRDIGGGICQVSTTMFRAAYFSGFKSEERWSHTFRFPFYEQDGYGPGLDASILQPDGAPFSGGDYSFYNPSATSWLLIEAYTETTDAPRAYVIIYGPDFGYTVTVGDPTYGPVTDPQPPDVEIVDPTLPPGTLPTYPTEYGLHSTDVSYDRTVSDSNGKVLFEDTLFSHYDARPASWTVSSDEAGQSPAATGATTVTNP